MAPEDRARPALAEIVTRFPGLRSKRYVLRAGQARQKPLPHDPFKAIVAPRPIGWISTRASDGRINLAPYSFFNAFSSARRSSDSPATATRIRRPSRRRAASSSPISRATTCAADERDLGAAAARPKRVRPRRPDDGAVPAREARRASRRPTRTSNARLSRSCSSRTAGGEPLGQSPRHRRGGRVPYRRGVHQERPFRHRRAPSRSRAAAIRTTRWSNR